MRLIDADALKTHVCDMCDDGQRQCKGDESCAILCWINDMPTIESDIDRAAIMRLCNEIEDVFCELCGKYEFPLYYYSEIMKRLKEIGKELTGNEQL